MNLDEIMARMHRIVRDFSPIAPDLKVEFLREDAYAARIRGKPLLPGEKEPEGMHEFPPLHSSIKSNIISVSSRAVMELVREERPQLRRPLVEGLILNEILYLLVARGPEMFPRAKAEALFRKYWPLQYYTVHGTPLREKGGPPGKDQRRANG